MERILVSIKNGITNLSRFKAFLLLSQEIAHELTRRGVQRAIAGILIHKRAQFVTSTTSWIRVSTHERPTPCHAAEDWLEVRKCPSSLTSSNRTLIRLEMPDSSIVTPYSTSATVIDRLWCVIMMNCVDC